MKRPIILLLSGIIFFTILTACGPSRTRRRYHRRSYRRRYHRKPYLTYKYWEWKPYNLKFKMPSYFSISKSNINKFEANDRKNITVIIAPWKDKRSTSIQVAQKAYNNVKAFRKSIIRQMKIRLNERDFNCYTVIGKGIQKGRWLYFAIFGIIDRKSDINFYYTAMWWANTRYNRFYVKIATAIASSFSKIRKTSRLAKIWKTWQWKRYQIKFKLPGIFKISENVRTRFVANDGQNMTVIIRPWLAANTTAVKVAQKAYEDLNATRKKIIFQKKIAINAPNFSVYGVVGKGIQKGKWLYYGIFGYVDLNSNINFYYTAMWWDRPNDNKRCIRIAGLIAQSFRKIRQGFDS